LTVTDTLLKNKKAILEEWFKAIISSYPEEAVKFITSEKDRFLNPIGAVIAENIDTIFDFLMEEKHKDVATSALESIIRVMAVQDMKPSKAISWVFYLKEILEKNLKKEDLYNPELYLIFHKIDDLMLLAFDLYMKCQEDIHRIRVKEQMAKKMGINFFSKEER